jgi:hypothetical protein
MNDWIRIPYRFTFKAATASIALSACLSSMAQKPLTTKAIVIEPGSGVGELALGDTHSKALELYPFKQDVDQEFAQDPDCGVELNFVDFRDPRKVGNVFVRFRDDKVFQIDVASSRYKTAAGISTSSSPLEVRKAYPRLRSYILSDVTSEALHDRPLIYWIGENEGIAFAFAWDPKAHERFLYEIIVFRPRALVCAPDTALDSPKRRELAPFSLQP